MSGTIKKEFTHQYEDWITNPEDWYSEHDKTISDDFELDRGQWNQVVGVKVGGLHFTKYV